MTIMQLQDYLSMISRYIEYFRCLNVVKKSHVTAVVTYSIFNRMQLYLFQKCNVFVGHSANKTHHLDKHADTKEVFFETEILLIKYRIKIN